MIWVMGFENLSDLTAIIFLILFFDIRLLSLQLHDFCRFIFYKVIPISYHRSQVSQINPG